MKKNKHDLDKSLFVKAILPVIMESYPLSKIVSVKVIHDVFRVHFLRIRMNPASGIMQSYMILKNGIVLFSEN